MKTNHIVASTLLLLSAALPALQAEATKFIPGKELTLIGKLMPTPDRYARVDTLSYGGFTDYQRRQLNQMPAGLALTFTTNSNRLLINFDYKQREIPYNGNDIASAGADLYLRRGGQWVYAGSAAPSASGQPGTLADNMLPGEKECLLYLPLRSIVDEVYIGIADDATIAPMDNPFRGKVVVWGSSFTHGTAANRSGMAYPLQLQRATGLDVRTLGVSGNAKLQQSYARLLADTDADAFVLDAFSNPSAKEIRERFDDFLRTVRAAHPGVPIIFQQTIYRGSRNFDTLSDRQEAAKMAAAEEVVRKAMATDPDVYFIYPLADTDGSTSTDRTHPSDWGYYNWMQSIRGPILAILARYGITATITQ